MLPITRAHHVHVPHSLAVLAGVLLLITALVWDRAEDANNVPVTTVRAAEQIDSPRPVERHAAAGAEQRSNAAGGRTWHSPLMLLDLFPH